MRPRSSDAKLKSSRRIVKRFKSLFLWLALVVVIACISTVGLLSSGFLNDSNDESKTHSHAGILNEPAPLQPHNVRYEGFQCDLGASAPEDQECPFPNLCLLNTKCTWWTEGRVKFGSDSVRWNLNYSGRPHQAVNFEFTTITDLDGAWDSNSWPYSRESWQPLDESKKYYQYSPDEVYNCLKGKRLLFTGDSMTRQIFHAVLMYIRGFSQIAERYYHISARYLINGTGYDNFTAYSGNDIQPKAELSPHEIEMFFDFTPSIDNTHDRDIDIVFLGAHYHLKEHYIDQIGEKLTHYVNMVRKKNTGGKVFWIAVPEVRNNKNFPNEVLFQRNDGIRSFIASGNDSDILHALPFDKMTKDDIFKTNVNDLHFMCSFFDEFPQQIDFGRLKKPADQDCRSIMNMNLIQVAFNNLCPRK